MSFEFNADEIFEMAEQMERNGATFYRKAAEKITEPASHQMLLNLAAMEDAHEKTFASMRRLLSDKDKTPTAFDPNNESVQYLKAFVETQVFFKKKTDFTSLEEVLKEAIVAEKDSIVFYLGMKDLIPERLGKEKLDGIIQEEMRHIRYLGKELSTKK